MSFPSHHQDKTVSLRTEGSLRVRQAEKDVEKAALDYSDYIKSYSRKVARKRTSFLEQ